MFLRALVAFLILPGMVAFVVPLLWLAPTRPWTFDWIGAVPAALGTVLLLWCVVEFYQTGNGTLAPWSPPTELVTSGLYGFSRNPMYVAVSLILWGWTLGFRDRDLAIYAVIVMAIFHVRVVFFEEPWLEDRYGETFRRYRTEVPRWLGPRRHARRG